MSEEYSTFRCGAILKDADAGRHEMSDELAGIFDASKYVRSGSPLIIGLIGSLLRALEQASKVWARSREQWILLNAERFYNCISRPETDCRSV